MKIEFPVSIRDIIYTIHNVVICSDSPPSLVVMEFEVNEIVIKETDYFVHCQEMNGPLKHTVRGSEFHKRWFTDKAEAQWVAAHPLEPNPWRTRP